MIQDSVKEAVSRRLRNPLLGAFAIAWVLFNWEFLAVLFLGDEPIRERISALKLSYLPFSHVVLYPAISATLFTVFGPFIRTLPMYLTVWSEASAATIEAELTTHRIAPARKQRRRLKIMARLIETHDHRGTLFGSESLDNLRRNLGDVRRERDLDFLNWSEDDIEYFRRLVAADMQLGVSQP